MKTKSETEYKKKNIQINFYKKQKLQPLKSFFLQKENPRGRPKIVHQIHWGKNVYLDNVINIYFVFFLYKRYWNPDSYKGLFTNFLTLQYKLAHYWIENMNIELHFITCFTQKI